jgi:hypothetical protein
LSPRKVGGIHMLRELRTSTTVNTRDKVHKKNSAAKKAQVATLQFSL